MRLEITGKVWKTGNGYVITIPKTLVTTGLLHTGQEIKVDLDLITLAAENAPPVPQDKKGEPVRIQTTPPTQVVAQAQELGLLGAIHAGLPRGSWAL